MNTKLLGALGMLGAPFLFLSLFPGAPWHGYVETSSLQGFFELVYMLGWMCSITGLIKLNATGTSRWGKFVLIIELVFLSLANCWNIWNILQINTNFTLYTLLDITWPLSNAWMLVISITIIASHRLAGWRLWVPFSVALWLPVAMVMSFTFGRNDTTLIIPGIYSAVAWFLLAYTIWSAPAEDLSSTLIRGNEIPDKVNTGIVA